MTKDDDGYGNEWHYSESLRPWEEPWYQRWPWRLRMLRDWLRYPQCRAECREAGHTALGFCNHDWCSVLPNVQGVTDECQRCGKKKYAR